MSGPERLRAPIVARTVKRWFFAGKGYATKHSAYQAKAKSILIEMVLGPYKETEYETYYLENYPSSDSAQERKELVDARFGMFFPHVGTGLAGIAGCCEQRGANECYRYDYYDTMSDFKYKSCKWSQDQWIRAKIAELLAQDAEVKP